LASHVLAKHTRFCGARYEILKVSGFSRFLPGAAFPGFSQLAEQVQNPQYTVPDRLWIAKTRAPHAFCAEFPGETAQNPVTRLWTACTRLKINQIEACSFR